MTVMVDFPPPSHLPSEIVIRTFCYDCQLSMREGFGQTKTKIMHTAYTMELDSRHLCNSNMALNTLLEFSTTALHWQEARHHTG